MTALSKEEYLKRYLNPVESGDYKKRKKKRKEKVKVGRGMKIVDDDVAWSSIAPKEDDDFADALLMEEEKPQVEVIDNRTKEEKAMDEYRKGNKWKIFDADKNEDDENVIRIQDSDSDMDIPRTATKQSDRHDSDSDIDAPRTKGHAPRVRHDSDSDVDISQQDKRHDSDSDIEIPRKSSKNSQKNKRHDSGSDIDIPRTKLSQKRGHKHGKNGENNSSGVKRDRSESGRGHNDTKRIRSKHKQRQDRSSRRHDSSDSDLNIPRSRGESSRSSQGQRKQSASSDSDLELPRARKTQNDSGSDLEIPRKRHGANVEDEKISKLKKGFLMSTGGIGGLTSRSELRKEIEERKKKEMDIDKLAKEGQNSATVYREKGGKKRDLKREKEVQDAENEEKRKKLEKYGKWGQGMKQDAMKSNALEDLIHETNKPLARYRDDADLDALQRSQMRDGDPMAAYLAKKKKKETANTPSLPKYRGPPPPPNRFSIMPGYRWDGVDRSNGFEKKYYESVSDRAAHQQDAYKWSVEDM